MHINITSLLRHRNVQVALLGVICVLSSFSVGVKTAGEVQPFTLIEAGSIEQAGDVDGSGTVDIRDAIAILEVAQGYRTASVEELKADPNGDGKLTVDDAARILTELAY